MRGVKAKEGEGLCEKIGLRLSKEMYDGLLLLCEETKMNKSELMADLICNRLGLKKLSISTALQIRQTTPEVSSPLFEEPIEYRPCPLCGSKVTGFHVLTTSGENLDICISCFATKTYEVDGKVAKKTKPIEVAKTEVETKVETKPELLGCLLRVPTTESCTDKILVIPRKKKKSYNSGYCKQST